MEIIEKQEWEKIKGRFVELLFNNALSLSLVIFSNCIKSSLIFAFLLATSNNKELYFSSTNLSLLFSNLVRCLLTSLTISPILQT